MGKSDKKIKSDRINSLRKQYDAFLEEDKKRKERNDYILSRLDKIRTSVAVVQFRHRSIFLDGKHVTSYNRPRLPDNSLGYDASLVNRQHFLLDVTSKNCDETLLLKEISKKYILIPKLNSTFNNDCTQEMKPNFEDNSNWKSKYDILDQLKKDEKEESSSSPNAEEQFNILNQNKEYYIKDNVENSKKNTSPKHVNKHEEPSIEYKLLEKDEIKNKFENTIQSSIPVDKKQIEQNENDDILIENPDINVNFDNNVSNSFLENNRTDLNDVTYTNNANPEQYLVMQPEYDYNRNASIEYPIENCPQMSNENVNIEYQEQYIPAEDKDNIGDTEKMVYHDQDSSYPIQTQDLNGDLSSKQDINQVEENQYPIDNINVQGFTSNDDITLQDNVNINPEGHTVTLHEFQQRGNSGISEYEPQLAAADDHTNNLDASEIEKFDTEQREMFYSEQANVNYDTYNTEVNKYFEQKENYQQNDQNDYYEHIQESFPVEINEHEETSQDYDQNYEQQYSNPIGEQQDYTQQPQQYEQVYDHYQGEFNELQKEQQKYDTVENIEQQLDNEQGFLENADVVYENVENRPFENEDVYKNVENRHFENEDVENEDVENEDVENEDVENEDVENEDVENKDVENKDVENKNVKDEDAENKDIDKHKLTGQEKQSSEQAVDQKS